MAADDLQGRVLAQVIADALGKTAKINVAARNDAYGTNLSNAFKEAWLAGGGTIPEMVIYNHQQPTLDSEAQRVAQGNPDGWLFIDFCPTFEKLALPLTRTGKWDPAKSFGSDTLNDCQSKGSRNYPGMRATQANASSGSSFPAFKALFEKNAKQGVKFQSFIAESFDSVFIALLAAIEVSEWAETGRNGQGPLGQAERAAAEGRFQESLEVFLAAVRNGAGEERDRGREDMLRVFAVLGDDDPLTQEYRRKLSAALF